MSRLRGIDLSHFYELMWGMESPFRKMIGGALDEAPTVSIFSTHAAVLSDIIHSFTIFSVQYSAGRPFHLPPYPQFKAPLLRFAGV